MGYTRLTRGRVLIGGFNSGSGSDVKKVATGAVSLDPGSIATVTRGTVTFTLTGAAAGDAVIMVPPATLNDDLLFVGARVTAADTVTVYLYNPTAGAIDDGPLSWTYLFFDLT